MKDRRDIDGLLGSLKDPRDYFSGVCDPSPPLPSPAHILLFLRRTKRTLQEESLVHRTHHRHVLILNLETPGHVHVDHRDLLLRPGQALLVFPFQFHHYTQLASRSLRWLFCTFHLERPHPFDLLRDRIVDLSEAMVEVRDALIEQWCACAALEAPRESDYQLLQIGLLRMLVEMKRALEAVAPADFPPPRDNLLRLVNRILSGHQGAPIQVCDIAGQLRWSPSRLRSDFRSIAGVPLGQYIRQYRLNRAMALLRTTDLSLADIAEKAGFSSPQAFSRAFRRDTGQSPRQYRRGGPSSPFP